MSKNDLRDKLDGDELDLSMMNLAEVPVKEIAALPRAHKIDLSSNQIVSLPANFAPSLQHITQLELGSNKLKELPTNIGCLLNLRHLDLYNNQLEDLPVSVSQLKSLKWLDVKGNPLKSELKRAGGDCLNFKECEAAARNIILYLKQVQSSMERQKQRKLKEERDKETAIKNQEDEEKAKKRADRKAAKEKRKIELAEVNKKAANGSANVNHGSSSDSIGQHRLSSNSSTVQVKSSGTWSVVAWLNLVLVMMLVGALGSCVYIYSEGDLSVKGLQATYPKVLKNMNLLYNVTAEALQIDHLKQTGSLVSQNIVELVLSGWAALEGLTGDLTPYTTPVIETIQDVWKYICQIAYHGYKWVLDNVDWNYILSALKSSWKFIQEQCLVVCEELGKNEAVTSVVQTVGVYTSELGRLAELSFNTTVIYFNSFSVYVQNEGPVLLENFKKQASLAYGNARQSIEDFIK